MCSAAASRTYLTRRGVPAEQHDGIVRFTHGYPLALTLVADLLGVPFSTYRRHLGAGLARVAEILWEGDVHGLDTLPGETAQPEPGTQCGSSHRRSAP